MSVGKPDAGNQHVRFDERGRKTEWGSSEHSHRARPGKKESKSGGVTVDARGRKIQGFLKAGRACSRTRRTAAAYAPMPRNSQPSDHGMIAQGTERIEKIVVKSCGRFKPAHIDGVCSHGTKAWK